MECNGRPVACWEGAEGDGGDDGDKGTEPVSPTTTGLGNSCEGRTLAGLTRAQILALSPDRSRPAHTLLAGAVPEGMGGAMQQTLDELGFLVMFKDANPPLAAGSAISQRVVGVDGVDIFDSERTEGGKISLLVLGPASQADYVRQCEVCGIKPDHWLARAAYRVTAE